MQDELNRAQGAGGIGGTGGAGGVICKGGTGGCMRGSSGMPDDMFCDSVGRRLGSQGTMDSMTMGGGMRACLTGPNGMERTHQEDGKALGLTLAGQARVEGIQDRRSRGGWQVRERRAGGSRPY